MMATGTGAGAKRRWPRIATVFTVILVAVVGVAVYFALRPAPVTVGAPPRLTPIPSSPATSAMVSGAPTVLADGCLGGTDPIKAIRIAHEQAPITPEGAAAFVATLVRWLGQVPHDPAEFQATGKLIWAPSLPMAKRTMPAADAGTTAWLTTTDARYRVTDMSGPDVTIEAFFTQTVGQDGTDTDVQHVGRFTVSAIDGHWALKSADPPGGEPEQAVAELKAKGLPYRGGC